jgi:hypothetical protein
MDRQPVLRTVTLAQELLDRDAPVQGLMCASLAVLTMDDSKNYRPSSEADHHHPEPALPPALRTSRSRGGLKATREGPGRPLAIDLSGPLTADSEQTSDRLVRPTGPVEGSDQASSILKRGADDDRRRPSIARPGSKRALALAHLTNHAEAVHLRRHGRLSRRQAPTSGG